VGISVFITVGFPEGNNEGFIEWNNVGSSFAIDGGNEINLEGIPEGIAEDNIEEAPEGVYDGVADSSSEG